MALERHIRHLEQVIKTNDALTIIETARMQHKNVYDTIEAAFTK